MIGSSLVGILPYRGNGHKPYIFFENLVYLSCMGIIGPWEKDFTVLGLYCNNLGHGPCTQVVRV